MQVKHVCSMAVGWVCYGALQGTEHSDGVQNHRYSTGRFDAWGHVQVQEAEEDAYHHDSSSETRKLSRWVAWPLCAV